MKILVIEDNTILLEDVVKTLTSIHFLCETATDFGPAEEKIALYQYDLAIIDINLPNGSGLNLIRQLKKKAPGTGIVVVSARNSLDNKIEGLEFGADDYITKPFEMAELVARVKSVIRRRNFAGNNMVELGGITIDSFNRQAFANQKTLQLTKSEFDILLFLFSNHKRVLTRESIAEHIWGDNMDLVDSFDFIYSHIKNLRKKIAATGLTDPIKVVYGVGYKFMSDDETG